MRVRKVRGGGIWWGHLLVGFTALFFVLQGLAAALGSDRGEYGLVVAGAVLSLALIIRRTRFSTSWVSAWNSLGLGLPHLRGILVGLVTCALMLCVIPGYAAWRNGTVSLVQNFAWLALGMLAQAGVAEELVFRGFLYGHIRRRHSFWRAALLSAIPFAAAHLYLFATLVWPVALSAVLLSIVLSFPLAHLYDLSGRAIWPGALVHAVAQGGLSLTIMQADSERFPIVWIAATTIALWLTLFIRPSDDTLS
jgi:membrane protease YdiL (CAAX protease family)